MTILDRFLGHDAWTTRQLLLRCRELSDEQLARKFDIGDRSLHQTFEHIIAAMESHTDFLLGRSASPREGTSLDALLARLTIVAKDFSEFATRVEREGRADEMATNLKGGNRRSLGGVITHVVTHGMHHRAQAIFMMEQLGLQDVIEGDVLGWEAVTRGWGWPDGGSEGEMVVG